MMRVVFFSFVVLVVLAFCTAAPVPATARAAKGGNDTLSGGSGDDNARGKRGGGGNDTLTGGNDRGATAAKGNGKGKGTSGGE